MESDSLKTVLADAVRLSHVGKLEEAIALLEPHVPLPTEALSEAQTNAIFFLCYLYLTTHQLRTGEKLLDAALALSTSDSAALHRRRAHFYQARGHHRKAEAAWKKVEEAEAAQPDPTLRAYSRVLRLHETHSDETANAIDEALAIVPKDRQIVSQLHLLAASTSFDRGRYDDAWKWAGKTIGHTSATPTERTEAMRVKGLIASLQGSHFEALDRLKEATFLARTGADWYTAAQLALTIATNLLLVGRITDAEVLSNEISTCFPLFATRVSLFQANCALERGAFTEAVAALKLAEAKNKDFRNGELRRCQALIAQERGDYSLALENFDGYLQLATAKNRHLARYLRLVALWQVGKHSEVETEWEILKTTFSESESRQLQMLHYRTEGRLAYLREDWTAGVVAWKQALRVQPHPVNLPEDWTLLGDGYAKQGESAAARFAWQRAAAQPGESIWVRRAKDRLESS